MHAKPDFHPESPDQQPGRWKHRLERNAVTCTEFLSRMTDYFDGGVDPDLLHEIQAHLSECDHCEILVNTTRQTIQIYRDHQVYEISTEVRERTISNIMHRCGLRKSA